MFRFLAVVLFVLCLSACGVSPKTHLYVLNSEPVFTGKDDGVSIGVWKVKLPVLLDRSEIVTRNGRYEVELADFHHWAGRLGPNINALIAKGLSQQLGTVNVRTSPWNSHKRKDYQVKIFIDRFDGRLGGVAVVSGSWMLLNGGGNKQLTRKTFTLKGPVYSKKYSDLVAVLSLLTSELSQIIAKEIEKARLQKTR